MSGDPVSSQSVREAYARASERYAAHGVDTEQALDRLGRLALSLHCWQGDDVAGFEAQAGPLGGGIAATGNYPGKARDGAELRRDLDRAYSLIPGRHRLNLHAIYAETGGRAVGRAQRSGPRALRGLDRVGQGQRPRPRLQPDLLLAPPGR